MGILKQNIVSGSETLPAINGAYLYLYKMDKILGIVSIPSPNLMADNYRDSIVENNDVLVDENGNEFEIKIISSKYGIDWEFVRYPNDKNILNNLRIEVKYNEY